MISVNQATVQFGGFELFSDVSFIINKRDRIGLVGKNGAGKTTLLTILAGKKSLSQGTISYPKEVTIGYLPQQMTVSNTTTVFNETLSVFSEVLNIEKEIEKLNIQLAERTDFESEEYSLIINKLSEKNDEFHLLGGNTIDIEVEKILLGLGFLKKDFNRLTNEFSGGWRMRIELAKILLKNPTVLLLDEPTNHLDILSIEWLEDLLRDYPGAVMMVSHDKTFLDNVTLRTIEISAGKTYDYKVPYSEFVKLRIERREQQLAAYKNQQKLIQDTEKFIEKFRYKATKAVQVQSRIKQLNKIERIVIDEDDYSQLRFNFITPERSGNLVIEVKKLSKSYGSLNVLNNIDFIVERGEKISFVGKNGEGKTTFAKVIVGELEYEGYLKVGHNVKIGYYAQNQAELLNENKTVFQTIDDIAIGDVRSQIRKILGAFLFSGEDVDKKVKVLSGGEKARLSLAKLLLEPYNLLILDEPTNHLDIHSKDVLKQALMKYEGTVIIVSHDRDFLNGLTDKIYEFENKIIKEHLGGIFEFLRKKKVNTLREFEKKMNSVNSSNTNKQSSSKQKYINNKEHAKRIKKINNKISNVEVVIASLEKDKENIEKGLLNPQIFSEAQNHEFYTKYQKISTELDMEMEKWSNLHSELEKLTKNR